MFAIPLAWLQLTYQKGRLAIAITGIMFAVVLIAMQLGFQEALFKSAVLLHLNLRSDLILRQFGLSRTTWKKKKTKQVS